MQRNLERKVNTNKMTNKKKKIKIKEKEKIDR